MDIALIGLGKMGLNMTLRLLRDGHRVVVHNRSDGPVETAVDAGAEAAEALDDIKDALDAPRVVWLMLPAGDVTDEHVDRLLDVLEPGDTIVDGANSRYTDSLDRAARCAERDVAFVDVGVSGGVWGLENGYSLMAGGADEAVERLEPALKTLAPAPDEGWGHVGPVGAGHFVKMVHNGIEYGMMQAFAEGFAIMDAKDALGEADDLSLDLGAIAEVWRTGSVVQSWLLDLLAGALQARPSLEGIAPFVPDSGEGCWTVEESLALRVPAPTIAASLYARFDSRDERRFSDRMLSAMRGQFGGHPVKGLAAEAGDGALDDDGTIDVVPGGVQTEGARTR